MSKKRIAVILALVVLALSACAAVRVHDNMLCVDLDAFADLVEEQLDATPSPPPTEPVVPTP